MVWAEVRDSGYRPLDEMSGSRKRPDDGTRDRLEEGAIFRAELLHRLV